MQLSETENKQALDEASMNNEQASQDVKEQPEVKAENAENCPIRLMPRKFWIQCQLSNLRMLHLRLI